MAAYDNQGKPIIPANQLNPNHAAPSSLPYPASPVNPQSHGGPTSQAGWTLPPTNVAAPYPTNNTANNQQGKPVKVVPVPAQPVHDAPVYGQPGHGVGHSHGHPANPTPTHSGRTSAAVHKLVDKVYKKDKDKKDKDKKGNDKKDKDMKDKDKKDKDKDKDKKDKDKDDKKKKIAIKVGAKVAKVAVTQLIASDE